MDRPTGAAHGGLAHLRKLHGHPAIGQASRRGARPGQLASAASIVATLAANVVHGLGHGPFGAAVAAWPAVALVGAYELLMRQVRVSAAGRAEPQERLPQPRPVRPASTVPADPAPGWLAVPRLATGRCRRPRDEGHCHQGVVSQS
jgi:hypothetical protein